MFKTTKAIVEDMTFDDAFSYTKGCYEIANVTGVSSVVMDEAYLKYMLRLIEKADGFFTEDVHDLKKDPSDLPDSEREVLVYLPAYEKTCAGRYYEDTGVWEVMSADPIDNASDAVGAWRENLAIR